MEDLQQAILYGIEAFKATPRGHPHYAGHVCNLINTLNSRYDRTGAMDHLQQLILYTKEVLVVTPQDHPYRACRLDTLARNLSSKYMRTGAMEDLQQALLYSKEASAATAQSHPHRASHIANLATTLNLQYERTGAIKDLEQAIFYNKEALEATPKGHPNQADHLEALARKLGLKYRRTTAVDDFRQAIFYGEAALAATTQDHPYRACCFDNLANTLGFKFEQTGAMDDLQQAILYGEKALETTLHHPDRAVHLNNLASRLCSRYERTGAMDDLKRAILYGEEALAATPLDYLYRACRLDSLAGKLGLRYKRTGYMEDLQQAILYSEAACAATPQDHSHRASHAGNLATTLSLRYERTGAMYDLQQAIFYREEALVATPKGHPDQAEHLSSLASILSLRYDRSGDMDDIQQAILYSKQALAAMAQDHPSRACYLSNLANQLTRVYERTTFDHPSLKSAPSGTQEQMTSRAVDDLQQAILYSKEALIATPEDHPHRANHLNSLTTALDLKYEQTKAIEDLQQAIFYGEEALAAVPCDHLNRAEYLGAAANRLLKRFELMSSAEDIGNCMLHLRASWSCSMSPPFHRVSAALLFARASYTLQVSEERSPLKGVLLESKESSTLLEESNSILEGAVLLLPRVSLRSLNRQDQQYNLFRLTGLAEDAASAALAAGKTAYDALKLLELSCGIMMGFAIDCRGDLSDLEGVDVELFKKFNRLRIEIDTPLPDRICSQDRTHITRRREQTIHEMEETIAEIRSLPGHEGFQLPPSSEELMSIAKYGPIVTFLSSRFRSDAIIVTSSVIYSIPLPKLHRDHREIPGRLGKIPGLTKGKLRTYAARNKELQEILFWLWDVAVGPVIQKLQLKKPGFTDLAHIWWIGVGDLNMAPFHAAGNYSDPSQTVFNYAISSYTPTIKALSYAREKDLTITKPDTQLLLITMPKTPGEKDLPDAEEEVARIVEVMKGSGSVLTEHLERPSAKDVLDRLQLGSCHAIHFACHGITDEKDPSSSHLVLLKNGEADKLTVQDISSRNTEVAQLAYLSACSTAHNPAMRLADEAIHIASGFQLAGFTHVVAAMWPSESRFCREISVDFYRSLFDGKEHHGIGEGHRKLRIAFYEAVKKVQKKYPNHPLKWAPFIHMGA